MQTQDPPPGSTFVATIMRCYCFQNMLGCIAQIVRLHGRYHIIWMERKHAGDVLMSQLFFQIAFRAPVLDDSMLVDHQKPELHKVALAGLIKTCYR